MSSNAAAGSSRTPAANARGSGVPRPRGNPNTDKFPSFNRALSPATYAAAQGIGLDNSGARELALGMTSSVTELISTIPSSYRDALSGILTGLHDDLVKRQSSQVVKDRLAKAKAEHSLPTELRSLAVPTLQLHKKFLESGGSPLIVSVEQKVDTLRWTLLDDMIEAKKQEIAFYDERVAPTTVLKSLDSAVLAAWENIERYAKVPKEIRACIDKGVAITNFIELEVSPALTALNKRVREAVPTYYSRVCNMHAQSVEREVAKKTAKVDLKAVADVEMSEDDPVSRSDISSLEKKIAALQSSLTKASTSKSVSLAVSDLSDQLTNLTTGLRSRTVEGLFPSRKALSARIGKNVDWWTPTQARATTGPQLPHSERQRAPATHGLQGERQGSGKASTQVGDSDVRRSSHSITCELCQSRPIQDLIAIVRAANWKYEHPHSYPDEILCLPTPVGCRLLYERVPDSLRTAVRFRANVHIGPGVQIPAHLQIHLSASIRFLLPIRPRKKLILDAWNEFKDRLRWRVHFMHEALKDGKDIDNEDVPFDPDYRVAKERKLFNQDTINYVELGLQHGDNYVNDYVRDVVPSIKNDTSLSRLVDLTAVKQYLDEHHYIVTSTDKNLGVAVVTREWFIENARKLLADQSNYKPLTRDEAFAIFAQKRKEIQDVSTLVDDILYDPQLARFLVSKFPADEDSSSMGVIPEFYGIPKMHKRPVKMRPIVPCHSNIQAPAGLFVAKQLRLLLNKKRGFTLDGTKHLAQVIDRTNKRIELSPVQTRRKRWIVSGDVVAFYPNIPTTKCLLRIKAWWLEHIGCEKNAAFCQAFEKCLIIATRQLVIGFQGDLYQQKQGLAMGLAHSPDLATLYAAWHEDKIFEAVYGASPDKPLSPELARFADNLLMIGRYLDDILGVVECDTKEEALATLRDVVRYDGLEIEWSVTEWHTPFLDMHVYIDPTSDRIEHRPYSKPLNHKERIPWISAHPKDVKKSTFIGEMSRMAVLSSKPEHYTDAVLELMRLYYRRGYPSDLVKHWALEQYEQRWNNRFVDKPREPDEVLVLKSQFNPVWSAFDVKELGNRVVTAWHLEIDNMLDRHSKHMAAVSVPVSPPPARNTPGSSHTTRRARVHTKTQRVRVSSDSVQRTLGDLERVVAARDNEDYVERRVVEVRGIVRVPPEGERFDLRPSKRRKALPSPSVPVPRTPGLVPTGKLAAVGHSKSLYELESVPDLRELGFTKRRWLVSRKRDRNIADLLNTWRREQLLSYVPDLEQPGRLDDWN